MKPHFYNFHSRLGMINVPYRKKELNVGVEGGGDAILTNDFLERLSRPPVDVFNFSKPEDIDRNMYFDVLAKELKEAHKLILTTLEDGETPVVLGGDNSASFPTLTSSLERISGRRVGYVRIDSHPDMNSIETSPSGNFHGMWMRPFIDSFENKKITNLVKYKITEDQLFFLGNLDIDPGEKKFLEGNAHSFSPDYIRQNKESMLMVLEQFIANYPNIYLGIDIDGFDSSVAPATGIPAQKGLFFDDVFEILERLRNQAVCIDLVEVNPKKKGAEQTVKLAQNILETLLTS